MQPTLKDQRWPGPSCACVSCFKPVAFLPMPSQDRHSWVDGNSAKLRKRSLHFRGVVMVGSGLFSIVSMEKSRSWWHQDTVVTRAVMDVNSMLPHASCCYPCPQESTGDDEMRRHSCEWPEGLSVHRAMPGLKVKLTNTGFLLWGREESQSFHS